MLPTASLSLQRRQRKQQYLTRKTICDIMTLGTANNGRRFK
uniref:Uncharacterized protein n=1 Tax=Phage sp. ctfRs3 TaxID=2826751 RepID=A0A8S5QTS4_9VIRU|nr:MAG TPA: hypothetical protein [Phage sp. ctfRs3]